MELHCKNVCCTLLQKINCSSLSKIMYKNASRLLTWWKNVFLNIFWRAKSGFTWSHIIFFTFPTSAFQNFDSWSHRISNISHSNKIRKFFQAMETSNLWNNHKILWLTHSDLHVGRLQSLITSPLVNKFVFLNYCTNNRISVSRRADKPKSTSLFLQKFFKIY